MVYICRILENQRMEWPTWERVANFCRDLAVALGIIAIFVVLVWLGIALDFRKDPGIPL